MRSKTIGAYNVTTGSNCGEPPRFRLYLRGFPLASVRATRRKSEPPSDAEIERGLRERAVSDPRAAEILLRRLQRPRAEERVGGVDLDSMSERELERLHAGLLRLAALPEAELRALVGSLLEGEELAIERVTALAREEKPSAGRHPRAQRDSGSCGAWRNVDA
jgi:hypothetical protein